MFRVLGLLVLSLLLPACAQVQLEYQSDSFNRASASTISEQTLLNAVRSSLDLPLSFTKLQKFTAGNMAGSSFAPRFPFGAQAPLTYDVAPTFTLSGGVSSIEYVDVNNGSALAKLNDDIPFATIERYMSQGIDPRLLHTIFVEYVEIDGRFVRVLGEHAEKRCRARSTEFDRSACDELVKMADACPGTSPLKTDAGRLLLPGQRAIYHFGNRAQSKCEFFAFQTAETLLRLAGFYADLGEEAVDEVAKNEEGKKVAVKKRRTFMAIWFEDASVQRAYDSLERIIAAEKKSKFRNAAKTPRSRPVIRYSFRSPKSLLTYLGELIALQNHARHRFVPTILQQDNHRITVFEVFRGAQDGQKAAVSVRGPDGNTYAVRHPEYGSELRNQTLRVLAMAGEVVNGAISEKDFPAPASIVVRPIQ